MADDPSLLFLLFLVPAGKLQPLRLEIKVSSTAACGTLVDLMFGLTRNAECMLRLIGFVLNYVYGHLWIRGNFLKGRKG